VFFGFEKEAGKGYKSLSFKEGFQVYQSKKLGGGRGEEGSLRSCLLAQKACQRKVGWGVTMGFFL